MEGEHQCAWRERAEALKTELAGVQERMRAMEATLAKLQRHTFGKRSEKMPSVAKALRDAGATERNAPAILEKRRSNAEAKAALPSREVRHLVPEADKRCPKCGGCHLQRRFDCSHRGDC